jgi:hypothetical protein
MEVYINGKPEEIDPSTIFANCTAVRHVRIFGEDEKLPDEIQQIELDRSLLEEFDNRLSPLNGDARPIT